MEVVLYDGTIPKSGKQIIEFSGIKLCHRSIAKDKSDILVHVDSGIIVRAYPKKTDRSVILNDLANNIDKLNHFIEHPNSYKLIERIPNIKLNELDVPREPIEMTKYSDGSCVNASCSSKPKRKVYRVKDSSWD